MKDSNNGQSDDIQEYLARLQHVTVFEPDHVVIELIHMLQHPGAIAAAIEAWHMTNGVWADTINRCIVLALARITTPGVEQALLTTLATEDTSLLIYVIWTLGERKSNEAILPLTTLLGHPDEQIRRGAAKALGDIGNRQAVLPLLQALSDNAVAVRMAAAAALGWLGDARAVQHLVNLADLLTTRDNTDDEDILILLDTVLHALGRIKSPLAIDPLVQFLHEPHWSAWHNLRSVAIESLGLIGNQRATPVLLPFLCDPDRELRMSTAEALGNLGDAQAVVPLMNALDDPYTGMRFMVIEALGKIGDPRAEAKLTWIQQHDQEEFLAQNIRDAAAAALAQIQKRNGTQHE